MLSVVNSKVDEGLGGFPQRAFGSFSHERK